MRRQTSKALILSIHLYAIFFIVSSYAYQVASEQVASEQVASQASIAAIFRFAHVCNTST